MSYSPNESGVKMVRAKAIKVLPAYFLLLALLLVTVTVTSYSLTLNPVSEMVTSLTVIVFSIAVCGVEAVGGAILSDAHFVVKYDPSK